MDDVKCSGGERRLTECMFSGWNNSNCEHPEDVGVVCGFTSNSDHVTPPALPWSVLPVPRTDTTQAACTPDTTIRLVNPQNIAGMGVVQLREGDTWYTICKYKWDLPDARVVCRMLCYDPDNALPGSLPFNTSYIRESMRYDEVQCTGGEQSLWNCSMKFWDFSNMFYDGKAQASCVDFNNQPPEEPQPQLNCTNGSMIVSFNLQRDPDLEPGHLSVAMPYTGQCNIVYRFLYNFLSMTIPFAECGTNLTSNITHIIYSTTITYLPTRFHGIITHKNTYILHLKCEIPRHVSNLKPIEPISKTVTQSATGKFMIVIHFYRDDNFRVQAVQNPLQILVGAYLFATVELIFANANLYLVVTTCYATPSPNTDDPVKYPLFIDKIPVDQTLSFFPLSNSVFGFRYQTFKFVQYKMVYLHCDAYVCLENDPYPECERSCFQTGNNCTVSTIPPARTTSRPVAGATTTTTRSTATPGFAGRRRRSLTAQLFHVSSNPILLYDPQDQVAPATPATANFGILSEQAEKLDSPPPRTGTDQKASLNPVTEAKLQQKSTEKLSSTAATVPSRLPQSNSNLPKTDSVTKPSRSEPSKYNPLPAQEADAEVTKPVANSSNSSSVLHTWTSTNTDTRARATVTVVKIVHTKGTPISQGINVQNPESRSTKPSADSEKTERTRFRSTITSASSREVSPTSSKTLLLPDPQVVAHPQALEDEAVLDSSGTHTAVLRPYFYVILFILCFSFY